MHVALRPRHVLSLCTGYGGLELAVRLACPGVRLVGACERQAYAAAVLGSRMAEDALDPCPVWDSLETFPCSQYRDRVDLVVAGFPCQGASVAGRRRGIEDERWLWPEVWRVTQEVGASWLYFENVPGLLSVNRGQAFEEILRDLAKGGWSAEWDCLAAATVGAPHARDRLFLLAANPECVPVWVEPKRRQRTRRRKRATLRRNAELADTSSARRVADADRAGPQGAWSLWTTPDGAPPERRGPDARGGDQPSGATWDAANADRDGCQGERDRRQLAIGEDRAAQRRDPDGRGGAGDRSRIIDAGVAHWAWSRAPEPCLRGVDDGGASGLDDSAYADQLHLLGNGVVPYQAAVAFTVLWERLHGPTQPLSGDE